MKSNSIAVFIVMFLCCFTAMAQRPDSLNFMPRPLSVKINTGRFTFTDQFKICISGPESAKAVMAANRFYQLLGKRTGIYFKQEFLTAADNSADATLTISYARTEAAHIGTDESYKLNITGNTIRLDAATDIGAMRGLETLYQLIMADGAGYYCPLVDISDSPRFKWRGLMIDVARHFIPMDVLKRNIDAMAEVKMNVLHLHLSDDEGFRVESKTYPLLQQKGSNGYYYTQEELKGMVTYAHNRGIIVVPEFDLPGHSTSILAAYPFLASYPADYKPARRFNTDTMKDISIGKVMALLTKSPTPTIDPSKESTYTFFDGLFKEMSGLFPDAYLHIGADENNGAAWKQNPVIVAFMNKQGMKTTDDLQAYFVKRLYNITKKYNKRMISWEEAFNTNLPADVIIQKWKPAIDDTLTNNILKHHNQLIVSNGFYLDLSMPAYIHYQNEPVGKSVNTSDAQQGILGCEAAIWSELVNADNEEIRVWPRAAVIAERMWSPAAVNDIDDMYRRLWAVDFELNDRGLQESSNYIRIISRWAYNMDVKPVQTLADLYIPVKGYKRLMEGMFSVVKVQINLASPMVNIADVVHCDSQPEWNFRSLVAAYINTHSTADLEKIKAQLQLWKNSAPGFNALAENAPYLQKIKVLSANLAEAAAIGLQALNGQSDQTQLKRLQQLKKPLFSVELTILPDIEALVTGKLNAQPSSYPLF